MIRKVKSIQQLYEEVKEYDLVITNDAPLNTALIKSLNKTHLGSFALTSKMIGSKYSDYVFEEDKLQLSQIVLNVQKNFNLSLKEALFYTKNIFNIWQYVGSLKECTQYFSKQVEKEIIEYLGQLPSYQLSMQMMDLSFLEASTIAVIGEELFTALDSKVLTQYYDSIQIHTDEEHMLDILYTFESQKDIIDRVVSMITPQNQDGVAIVLNIESDYLPLIKAKLINNNIELNEKLYLYQDFRVREFLSILEVLFSLHNMYTKELIPIGSIFNIEINSKFEDTLFLEISKVDSNAKELLEVLQTLKQLTFKEFVKKLGHYNVHLPHKLTHILQSLELDNTIISYENILDLKYFIEHFDEEIEANKKGVLLIDAKNSSFINRDVIFYIGMDNSWVKNIDSQKYISFEEELQKNIISFEILLQQGKERFFFIPKNNKGNEVIPPYYFNFLLDTNIESYSSKYFNIVEISNNYQTLKYTPHSNFQDIDNIKHIDTISASALNKFSECPKKFAYSKLISGAQRDFFLKGTLIHAFAEFYVNHKEFVRNKELEEFVDIIMNELQVLSNPLQNHILRTQIRLACKSVIEFIDSIEIDTTLHYESSKNISINTSNKNEENVFSQYYKLPITLKNTELEFKDLELGLNGFIDLAINRNTIVDYKTGRSKKVPSDIIKKSNFKEIVTRCDFQPLVYLSVFRKIAPNTQIDFLYNFPMIDSYNKIMENPLEENIVKVHYIPNTFNEFIQTDTFKEYFSELLGNDARKIFEEYNSEEFFKEIDLTKEEFNKEEFIEKHKQNFIDFHISKGIKENAKTVEHLSKLFSYIVGFKFGEKVGNKGQKKVFYYTKDLDEFENFVQDSIKSINQSYKDRFPYHPVEDRTTCENCEFKKMCLKQGVRR